jgi:hypothetical protein
MDWNLKFKIIITIIIKNINILYSLFSFKTWLINFYKFILS